MGCAKCGKSMKIGGAKKMAKGGMPDKIMGAPKKPFAAGIPYYIGAGQTGPESMKKGGAKKAKFGSSISVPVKHSPPVGKRHNDLRTGFEPVASAKVGGSLKAVPADKLKSLGKLPEAVRNKMGFKKSGGMTKKAVGGPILDKLKEKLAERKVTKTIKKGIKQQVKEKKKLG